ncbi:MAG: right-handed parallel beta-helix repeat-containing protein [Ruminococcaceae bacterium]|nr:right-handed parallel beta-helix repeat-containing protein [Oscillospiraceae bacterium]
MNAKITAKEYILDLKEKCNSGLSDAEIRSEIDRISEERIAEIIGTKTDIEIAGICYYLSNDGDDNNDGRSPDTAWKTIDKLNESLDIIKADDGVFFRRGDLFRGSVKLKTGVTYSAYGKGEKPVITSSICNCAEPSLWKKTDVPFVWEYTETIEEDVGHIVFDDTSYARKIIRSAEADGSFLDFRAKRKFFDYHDMCEDMTFWHNCAQAYEGDGKVYLRCEKGNPGKLFGSIEMGRRVHGMSASPDGCNNVRVDNICIAYVGSHGIGVGTCDGLTVTNCVLKWIGGSIQTKIGGFGRTWPTPFGNGIEIYGQATNFTVDNCYIYQCYDAGVTHQFSRSARRAMNVNNVRYINNVICDCVYNIEIFYGDDAHDPAAYPRSFRNNLIANNILRTGGGFGHFARPDENVTALIRHGSVTVNTENYNIRNNILDRSLGIMIQATDDGASMARLCGNIYVQEKGKGFCTRSGKCIMTDDDTLKALSDSGKETDATVVII